MITQKSFIDLIICLCHKHHITFDFNKIYYYTGPDWWDGLDGSELYIDIVGVEKEVEMLPVFVVSNLNQFNNFATLTYFCGFN